MKIGASFSVGRVAYAHDVRITQTNNVDESLSNQNVILCDKLLGRSVEEYTNERMQPAIDRYNAKQKRKNRQITTTYCEYFNNLKDHGDLCYEAVLQFGEHETLGKEFYSPETSPERKLELRKQYEAVYKTMIRVMQQKYPHLEILYATIHFDEPNGTPHLHVCYQGIGTNYKQGLDEQVSIGNALGCDGIERIQNRAEAEVLGGYQISKFYREFRCKYFIPVLKKLGYEIKEEQHGLEHKDQNTYELIKQIAAAQVTIEDYMMRLLEQGKLEVAKVIEAQIQEAEKNLGRNRIFQGFLKKNAQEAEFERFKTEAREKVLQNTENRLQGVLEMPEDVQEAFEFINKFTM